MTSQAAWAAPVPTVNNPFEQETRDNFNFVVAGDFGCDNIAKQTVSGMIKREPELVIGLGDLSYNKNLPDPKMTCKRESFWYCVSSL
jgi:hypothetical protein